MASLYRFPRPPPVQSPWFRWRIAYEEPVRIEAPPGYEPPKQPREPKEGAERREEAMPLKG